ncbi:MAG: hypothetical protein U1D30_02565 [Planctomycetota bacterium]
MTLSIPTRVLISSPLFLPGSTDEVYELMTYEGLIVATAVVPEAVFGTFFGARGRGD